MELGDKVQFCRHYKKTRNYLDLEDDTNWTEEQKKSWDEDDYAVMERAKVIEHLPMIGFVAGKRNIAVTETNTPKSTSAYFGDDVGAVNSLQQVHLIAVKMSGFYRVHPDWIKAVDVP